MKFFFFVERECEVLFIKQSFKYNLHVWQKKKDLHEIVSPTRDDEYPQKKFHG